MEIFNFEQHMDDFLKNKVAVNCSTKEEANNFFKILEDKYSIKWGSGDYLLFDNYWRYHENRNRTCYNYENGLCYASIGWYNSNDYKVLQYNISEQKIIKENVNIKQSKTRRIFIIEE